MRCNSFYELNKEQVSKLNKRGISIHKISVYQLKDLSNNKYEFIENHNIYLIDWHDLNISEKVNIQNLLKIEYLMSMSSTSGEVNSNIVWFFSDSKDNSRDNALKLLLEKQEYDLLSYENKINKCKSKIQYLLNIIDI